MASSEKVYVCGRCGDYGAPNLEDLVTHMTNCGVPEIRKKDETKLVSSSPYEDEDENDDMTFDESENSQNAIEYVDISLEKDSPPQKKKFLDGSPTSSQFEYQSHTYDGGRTSPSPFLWSKKTGLILLNLLKSRKEDMESPYIRRKTVWQKIAMEMQEKYGYCVSASQCENKFKNMSNRYRRARDHNLNPERSSKQTCFLYEELDEFFRSGANYQPRRESLCVSKIKQPKIIRPSLYIESDTDCADREPMHISDRINISNREPINSSNRESINFSNRESISISIREPINISTIESINASNREPKNISKGESSSSLKDSDASETEPIWIKRMMETFERCHRENMKMQREFIDVLKKILEKK